MEWRKEKWNSSQKKNESSVLKEMALVDGSYFKVLLSLAAN